MIRREAESEAAKIKFLKNVYHNWLVKKNSRCDQLFTDVPFSEPPKELNELVELLKESYPHTKDISSMWKNKANTITMPSTGYVGRLVTKISWCYALRDIEKELAEIEKKAFIEEYIANNAERIQKIINQIEGDKNIRGLRKLVGNNSNSNNNLLKFPPREEELKGLFNAPVSSNKTRSRKRKNRKTRKTLRKRN